MFLRHYCQLQSYFHGSASPVRKWSGSKDLARSKVNVTS
jgi:hypothetical protein